MNKMTMDEQEKLTRTNIKNEINSIIEGFLQAVIEGDTEIMDAIYNNLKNKNLNLLKFLSSSNIDPMEYAAKNINNNSTKIFNWFADKEWLNRQNSKKLAIIINSSCKSEIKKRIGTKIKYILLSLNHDGENLETFATKTKKKNPNKETSMFSGEL